MTATPRTATLADYHLENVHCLSLLNRRAFRRREWSSSDRMRSGPLSEQFFAAFAKHWGGASRRRVGKLG